MPTCACFGSRPEARHSVGNAVRWDHKSVTRFTPVTRGLPEVSMENQIHRVNVGDMLTRSAATRPGKLAVVDSDRRWTYSEFNAWVNRLANGLAGRGYARGEALGLASANSAEFLAVYFA